MRMGSVGTAPTNIAGTFKRGNGFDGRCVQAGQE